MTDRDVYEKLGELVRLATKSTADGTYIFEMYQRQGRSGGPGQREVALALWELPECVSQHCLIGMAAEAVSRLGKALDGYHALAINMNIARSYREAWEHEQYPECDYIELAEGHEASIEEDFSLAKEQEEIASYEVISAHGCREWVLALLEEGPISITDRQDVLQGVAQCGHRGVVELLD